MPQASIRETLQQIGAIDTSRVIELSPQTRDREVPVYLDPITQVIFIDDFYVGDSEYSDGPHLALTGGPDYEDFADTQRRITEFKPLFYGRSILDFGCGAGTFLRGIRNAAAHASGIELRTSYRDALNAEGIPCFRDLTEIRSPVETAFLFHVLEHLPDPLTVLRALHRLTSASDGTLVVEVPHARDFLISDAHCQAFIDFTLWSQHLVLHTRDSLRLLLGAAGYKEVTIYGIQRYGLANHLSWLTQGKAGGHRGTMSYFETPELSRAYGAAHAARDSTDTLVAVARL